MKMRVGIIVQARMSSARLPRKVLKQLEGRPMLWHIIERLKEVKLADELVVATSVNLKDREIVDFARSHGIGYFTGSEEDVLDRYYQAAKEFQFGQIVRATGDNPLVDPEEVDRLVSFHTGTTADYSSSKSEEVNSGLPVGVGVEIFSFVALERMWLEAKSEEHREHVDDYILENRDSFNVKVLQALESKRAPHLRLTVDTEEEFNLMADIYRRFYTPGHIVPVEQVIRFLIDRDQNKR